MTDNTNIHQRIGEAITSGGEFNIIRANDSLEEQILTDAGFVKVGSMKEGDKIVSLFKVELKEKEVVKIVEVPNKNISWPFNDQSHPFRKPDPGIWYYNNQWKCNDPNNQMYTNLGTGTGNADWALKDLDKTLSKIDDIISNSSWSRDMSNKTDINTFNGTLSTRLDAAYDPLKALNGYFSPEQCKNQ